MRNDNCTIIIHQLHNIKKQPQGWVFKGRLMCEEEEPNSSPCCPLGAPIASCLPLMLTYIENHFHSFLGVETFFFF